MPTAPRQFFLGVSPTEVAAARRAVGASLTEAKHIDLERNDGKRRTELPEQTKR